MAAFITFRDADGTQSVEIANRDEARQYVARALRSARFTRRITGESAPRRIAHGGCITRYKLAGSDVMAVAW